MEISKRKSLAGKRFLSFDLDSECYCIEILKVKEILGMTEVTPIPQTPVFIKGVINLRGSIIPIIDLRLKFEMPEKDYMDRTCIIVVEIVYKETTSLLGVVVDTIHEAISIPKENIASVPYINAKIKSDYITGIAEIEEEIKIIIDITKILTEDELVLSQALKHAKSDKSDETVLEKAGEKL